MIDDVGERTGRIRVELLPDDAAAHTYRIATDGTQIVTATIWDDDAPELKIVGDGPVTEGAVTNASFTISSAVVVTSLTINYTPESANFIETGSGTPTSTPSALIFTTDAPYTTKLLIPVHNDDQADPAGSIRVTLNEEDPAAATYTVASSPDNTATVAVTDDESLPLITIAAPTSGTAESAGSVGFVISATTDLGDNFRVRYDPSEVAGDFLKASAPENQEDETEARINFSGSAGNFTAVLSVPIDDDDVGERTGQIEVTLLADDADAQTYQVATDGSQSVRATIWDEDAPELKISGGDRVTEGPSVNARFNITSEVEVSSLTVNYTPRSDSFLESGSGTPTTTMPALTFTGDGPWVAPLDIAVHDDEATETNGTITVTLNEEDTPATTYTVAVAPDNAASVNVTDDDSLPLLTITAPAASNSRK